MLLQSINLMLLYFVCRICRCNLSISLWRTLSHKHITEENRDMILELSQKNLELDNFRQKTWLSLHYICKWQTCDSVQMQLSMLNGTSNISGAFWPPISFWTCSTMRLNARLSSLLWTLAMSNLSCEFSNVSFLFSSKSSAMRAVFFYCEARAVLCSYFQPAIAVFNCSRSSKRFLTSV